MKNILKLSILLLTISVSLSSCKKDKADTTAPIITINSPLNQAVHTSGDMLHIDIDFEDNDELHELKAYFIATHMSVADTVLEIHAHPHSSTYSMMEHYTIGNVMHTDFSLEVEASDHSGNVSTARNAFHVME